MSEADFDTMSLRCYGYPTADLEFCGSRTYLSAAELKSNLQEIGASDAVLLFDTCNSGAFLNELDSSDTRARQSADEGKQELEKIINGPESTEFMLTGAAAGRPAYDLRPLDHGFLTGPLLLSMRDALDATKLHVANWLDGAEKRTAAFEDQYKYRQYPPETKKGGPELEVAVFPTAEIDCIPDLNTPPLLEKPVFVDSNGDDNLDLDAEAKEMLNDSKGGSAARAFVYSRDKSDVAHIRMRVRYTASPGHRSMNIGFRYGTDERYNSRPR